MNNSDEIGFLVVSVKTANGALPIEGASVTIYAYEKENEKNGSSTLKNDVIYNLKTDLNGKTPKIALKTKSKSLSNNPENVFPYQTYNAYVTKDGYYDSTYINIPIFQGITSLQEADLIPLSEFASPTDPIPNSSRQYKESMN